MPAIAPPDPPPSDGAIALRAWTPVDVPALTEACQDPEIPRWTMVPRPYTDADARAFVAGAAGMWERGDGVAMAIVAASDDRVLGSVGLNVIDWDRGAADVGYWVAAAARRRGVAVRGVELICRWAFADLGLEHLDLRPHRDNLASQAVARRAGFAPVADAVTRRLQCHGPEMLVFARRRDGAATAA